VQTIRSGHVTGRYDYDDQGLRIRHQGSERGDVDYYHDGRSIIEERNAGDGSLLARYSYADKLLSLTTPAGSQYYHHDALGSTVNLTDGSGATKVSYFINPWGLILNQIGFSENRQVFTGKEIDERTGLVYFGARYYDPDTGRFINQDEYLGEQEEPPSLHRYLYAYSNPLVYVDEDGNESIVPHMVDPNLNKQSRKIYNRARVQDMLEHDPNRFADDLHDDENAILDNMEALNSSKKHYLGRMTRYTVEDLSGKDINKAKKMFGNSDGAISAYLNWKNRDLISQFFFLNGNAFRSFVDGGYQLAKVVNPVHAFGDAGYRAVTGQDISGNPASREEAVSELVLMFTAYKIATVGRDAKAAASIRNGGFALNDEVVEVVPGTLWSKTNTINPGKPWEKYVIRKQRLTAPNANNFNTFDGFDLACEKGVSCKAMNLNMPGYTKNPKSVYNTLTRYIDKAANFKGDRKLGYAISPKDIPNRTIELAVPSNPSKAHLQQLQRAAEYAQQNGIQLKVTRVK
jgi:RHS repeat-associated protein